MIHVDHCAAVKLEELDEMFNGNLPTLHGVVNFEDSSSMRDKFCLEFKYELSSLMHVVHNRQCTEVH